MKVLFEHMRDFLWNRFTGSLFAAWAVDLAFNGSKGLRGLLSLDFGSVGILVVYYIATLIVVAMLSKLFSTADPIFNNQIIEKVNQIIDSADRKIAIVSPYVNMGNNLIEKLITKARSGTKIAIYHNSSELQKPDFVNQLNRLRAAGISFYNHPRLHAKIVQNERECVVSSLNLLVSSIENSLEAGYHVSYGPKLKEIEGFIADISQSDLTKESEAGGTQRTGYCIKSRISIDFNRWKPIDYSTYLNLRDSGKLTEDGEYCHFCGRPYKTTVKNPFCDEHQSMN